MSSGQRSVLVVEDDAHISELVCLHLGLEGYQCEAVGSGTDGLKRLNERPFDVVVLDLMLPGVDGIAVCRAMRRQGPNRRSPVLMLTARREESDTVLGLESGADDYLTKPFSPRTLLARVKALLRRAGMEASGAMAAGELALDLEAHALKIADAAPIRLTKLETRLLQILIANAGHVVGTERLLTHVWGHRGSGDRQLLKQLVRRLRQKIENDPAQPRYLQTESGAGYRLVS